MNHSTDGILTTHVGSLPRPADLLDLANANPRDERRYAARLQQAVVDVVQRQSQLGVDIVDDGSGSKRAHVLLRVPIHGMSTNINYGIRYGCQKEKS